MRSRLTPGNDRPMGGAALPSAQPRWAPTTSTVLAVIHPWLTVPVTASVPLAFASAVLAEATAARLPAVVDARASPSTWRADRRAAFVFGGPPPLPPTSAPRAGRHALARQPAVDAPLLRR